MNKVSLIGNLTRDVDCGGTEELSFCKGTIAVNNGKSAEFIPFTAFGNTSNILRAYTTKGSKIALSGYLKYENWEQDGKKVYALKFIANEVELLSRAEKIEKNELREATAEETNGLPF